MIQFSIVKDWRSVLRRAWSMRLIVGAAVLSGLEFLLPFAHAMHWLDWMPVGVFGALSFLTICGAFMARLIAQKNMGGRS